MSENIELPTPDSIRAKARRDFPQFYLLATPEEEDLMDALVLARVAVLGDMAIPRQFIPPGVRVEVEKTTDAVERLFTTLREAVRGGAAFGRDDDEERAKIERDLFEVVAPGNGS